MIERRFTMFGDMANIKQWILDRKDNSRMSSKWEILDKLNELAKENEQLKSICQDHRDHANDFKADCVRLEKENEELKELLELISKAHSFTKEESVKEILRHEIRGIDTVIEDSAMAWNDYCVLSKFFKKQYGEHWDNE